MIDLNQYFISGTRLEINNHKKYHSFGWGELATLLFNGIREKKKNAIV